MLRMTTSARVAAVAVAMTLVLAACGQHPGTHQGGSLIGAGNGDGSGAVIDPNTGEVIDPGTGAVIDPGTGGGTGGGSTGGGTGGPGTGGGPAQVGGGDRTGVTDTSITIGLHAPLTGAAPIEPKAFNKGKDLYWRYLSEVKKQKIHGRDVKVVFANDEYTPTTAVAVCNKMATSDKAFLLIGGAGTDQINSCAEYAEPRGIPYISPGVQEDGLNRRRTYFAVTMSYKAQMAPLVQLLKKENGNNIFDEYGSPTGKDGKITLGFVRPNTPNFEDAAAALKAATQAAGWTYKEFSVVKEGSSGEAKTTATSAAQGGVDILVPITAPTFTVQLALNADTNGYKPQWAGVAVSNNINQFLDSVCQRTGTQSTVEGALWFSPWPGWKQVMANEYDPDFKAAAQKYAADVNTRNKGGDIMLALWGISKAIHQALLAAGPTVSRQSFVATMSQFQLSTKFFPDLQFTPGNPFGAKNVHVLRASCDEPGDSDNFVARGAQYVEHPKYPGLRSSF